MPALLTTAEAAEWIGISLSHLNRLRLYNPAESPPFIRVGRKVLYRREGVNSLDSWVESRLRSASADSAEGPQ